MALVAVSPWQSLDAGARAEQLEQLKRLPLDARVVAASEGFLGTPYVLSPLGEGAGPDRDPLLRYDAADCLTMVEESMALALAPDEARVLETLSHIRYQGQGEPSFDGRLHVMEAQWLPVNVERGLLEDVTKRYGKDVVRRVSKRITEKTWQEKAGKALGVSPQAQVTGEFFLDLIPSDRAPTVLAVAPEGLVVVVVRADRPRLVTRITHVALLVQKPAGPYLRHASRSFKKVVDEPVERYLKRNLEFGAWTVEGVALYQVRSPGWLDAGSSTEAPALDAGVADAGYEPAARAERDPVVDAGPSSAPAGASCGCGLAPGALLGLVAVWFARRRR